MPAAARPRWPRHHRDGHAGRDHHYKESLRQRGALLKGKRDGCSTWAGVPRAPASTPAPKGDHRRQAASLTTLLVSGRLHLLCRPREGGPGHRLCALQHAGSAGRPADGRMVDQTWGDIWRTEPARRTLLKWPLMGISPQRAIAVGDGANDLPMMGAVNLSVVLPR